MGVLVGTAGEEGPLLLGQPVNPMNVNPNKTIKGKSFFIRNTPSEF
jgi:hypothetical protein